MNKHTYIIVMGLIAIVLLILTNFITESVDMNGLRVGINVIYVLTTGLIGILLHRKFVNKN